MICASLWLIYRKTTGAEGEKQGQKQDKSGDTSHGRAPFQDGTLGIAVGFQREEQQNAIPLEQIGLPSKVTKPLDMGNPYAP